MKTSDLIETHEVEGELLKRSSTPAADKMGRFFAREAVKRFGNSTGENSPERRAKQMAGNFYQAMLNTINDEFKTKKISPK